MMFRKRSSRGRSAGAADDRVRSSVCCTINNFSKTVLESGQALCFDRGLRIRFRSPPRDDMILTRHRLMDYP